MDLVEAALRSKNSTGRHPWELARLRVVNTLLKGLIKNDPSFTVLDVGCGDIFFVRGLSALYPRAHFYAIDTAFTDEIIGSLKTQIEGSNISLHRSLDEASAQLARPADLVLLLDVIEHIEDDIGFLRMLSAHRSFSPDTMVMITVPAYQDLFCSHDKFLGHYRRYTNKTLLASVSDGGFRKIESGYFFAMLVPPRYLEALIERMNPRTKKQTTGLVEWRRGRLLTNFMKLMLLADFRISHFLSRTFRLKLPGLSNYIICRKL